MPKKVDLDQMEDIGRGLQNGTEAEDPQPAFAPEAPSMDASDLVWAEFLQRTNPDLVLPKYFTAFICHKKKLKGWESQAAVGAQKSINATQQTVHVQFKRIEAEIAKMKHGVPKVTAEISITPARMTEILRAGHLLPLDPRELLTGPDARRYQRRRFRSQYKLPELAESIGKVGMLSPPIIREKSEPDSRRLNVDGFGRLEAWILADEKAGGTSKKPLLDYPICLAVDCTDKEAAFIAFESNRRRENFDDADRDYSIVMLHEQQAFSADELAPIAQLDRSTISHIIHAFQDVPQKTRTALEDRMITTKHAREIAKLKEWPDEQERLSDWLLTQVDMVKRTDANYERFEGVMRYDQDGVSAGQLQSMVTQVVERKKQAKKIAAELEKMKDQGKVEATVDAEKSDTLRTQLSKKIGAQNVTKRTMQEALRTAGIKVSKPKDEIEPTTGAVKPRSPSRFREDREQPPIKPCMNCTLYYEATENCLMDLKPDAENKCAVQPGFMGRPRHTLYVCSICGGKTPDSLMKANGFTNRGNRESKTEDHDVCGIDQYIACGRLGGKCAQCQPLEECDILDALERSESLRLQVLNCDEWFTQRPTMTVTELNTKIQAELDALKDRILNKRPGRPIAEVRAEFPQELKDKDGTWTLVGIYEHEEEADNRADDAYTVDTDEDIAKIEVRGGFGDPKLWGVYVRPLEQESDEESDDEVEDSAGGTQ
jgi:ParB-like chromosome segregation protein Spo0J